MKGGYRKGAGRKQGFAAKSAEEARKLLSERVAQEIGPISNALISQAKKGDVRAIKELFDRAWGRSFQAAEITHKQIPLDNFLTPEQEYRIAKRTVKRYENPETDLKETSTT